MSDFEFLPRDTSITPTIYAYSDPRWKGLLKIGYTDRQTEVRVKETEGVVKPEPSEVMIEYETSAMRSDGSIFTDHDVHRMLRNDMHVICQAGEWYRCSVDMLKRAIYAVRNRLATATSRIETFKMRPEQRMAVEKTKSYFESFKEDMKNRTPKFLWNAKMRFGKTFASYELAKAMNFKRVLVLTFKPAVKSAWKDDLNSHVDFEGWQFISNPSSNDKSTPSLNVQYEKCDKSSPIVCFGSLQDLLGVGPDGKIKAHNGFIHEINWDLVIFDEYHFGAWKERSKDLFAKDDEEEEIIESENETKESEKAGKKDTALDIDESFLPITTEHYLFLSGTPFRAISSGEFIEEQIFSWTYSDEQSAKENWNDANGPNPYLSLPRMVMMTYKLPESIRKIALNSDFNEFDLNVFFDTKGNRENAEFIYKDYVQKWLDLIRGSYMESTVDELKSRRSSPFPYSDIRLRQALQHTLWFLPTVNSCYAMRNLLAEKQNVFYKDYKVIVVAGSESGQGAEALIPVEKAMDDPLKTHTITLSCGKLTTGVTVKPWTGIFMLRNLSQPETYFQAAFRVQSPWVAKDMIIKRECYVFDFAPNRTLRQLSEYSCQLNVKEKDPEKKVSAFIRFLPVLSYEGNIMREIDAKDILDIASSGISATLLARRWESALLVNVDNETLERLLNNKKALDALMQIEGFRSLNDDIKTIINKSEEVKKAKKEGKDKSGTKEEKKELSNEEKEYKSKRKEIQEKLIKFATRIPIFMYLTDFREVCLKDVITKLEPNLFKKVTGLNVEDFELLASLGLFNEALMNDAIFKFRRYEEASLEYTGINKHTGKAVGGYSTVLKNDEFNAIYGTSIAPPNVGDIVNVKDEGIFKVSSTINEKFSVKNDKGRTLHFLYPDAFEKGTVRYCNK